jgi:hypothetical protein
LVLLLPLVSSSQTPLIMGLKNSLTNQRIEGVLDLIGGKRQAQTIGNPPEHLRLPEVDRHGEVRVAAPCIGLAMTDDSRRSQGH